MNISFAIAKRIAFNKQKSFATFIIRLSVAATALSVAAMILTLSFVNGFQATISDKVFSFWGHIRVQHFEASKVMVAEETPILENDTITQLLKKEYGVQHVQTFATKSVVIEKNKEIEGVLLKGISANYDSVRFKKFLVEGSLPSFVDSGYSKNILLSADMANTLQAKLNDTIKVYAINSGNITPTTFRKLIVTGIYKTGIEEYDKLFAIVDIKLLQKINGWQPNQIGGYEIFLKNYNLIDTVNNNLLNNLPIIWLSRSIKEVYPNTFDWLNIQDVNRNVVFVIMSLVAIINLITCLLILVLERTRMIGVLKAVGASNSTIQKIFIYYAFLIVLIGIGTGLFVGIGLSWLQESTHFIHLDEANYYISYAPILIIWWQVALVCIATAFICFAALLIPSLLVRKIQPIKAIQFR